MSCGAYSLIKMKKDSKHRKFNLVALIIIVCTFILMSTCGTSDIERSANETSAVETLKTLTVNQRLYLKMHHGDAYGTFDQLIDDLNLDKRFAGDAPVISGYIFSMKVITKSNSQPPFFSVNADPQKT